MKRALTVAALLLVVLLVGLSFAQEKPEPTYWYSFSVHINLKSDQDEASLLKSLDAVREKHHLDASKCTWIPASKNQWRRAKEQAEARGHTYPDSQFVMQSRYIIGGRDANPPSFGRLSLQNIEMINADLVRICESPIVDFSYIEISIRPQYFDPERPTLRTPPVKGR